MKKFILLFCLFFSFLCAISQNTVTRYVAVGHINDTIKIMDTASFSVLHSVKMNCDSVILGATGIARHPQTGVYYVMLRFQNLSERHLCTVNPVTGDVTIIGNVGDRMSNIIFLPSGELIGVTGDGALTPESLFYIDISNGSLTFIRTLGAGSGGEAIGYCPDNGKIFHRSGISQQAYEKIDTVLFNVVPIPQTNNPNNETFCLLYIGNKSFVSIDGNNDVVTIDTAGLFTYRKTLSQPYKGLEFFGCTRTITGNLTFCQGSNTILTASSGAFSYQWFRNGLAITGQTSQTLTVTQAGNYNCYFTDACGADSLGSPVSVQMLNKPVVTLSGPNEFCQGSVITITGSSGGTSQWYRNGILIPGATSNTYQVSIPGHYNMVKTNTNGCSDSAAVGKNITQNPKPIAVVGSIHNLRCNNDASGSISVSVSAGTPAFNFLWSDGSTQNPNLNMQSGNYTVYITDSKNCKDTVSASVSEPPALQLNTSQNDVTCYGQNNGSAIATASGGSGTLSFAWSHGPVTSSVNNLVAGQYIIEVTDDSLCLKSDTLLITQPDSLWAQINITDNLCNGESNGQIEAIVSGGVFPYTYVWSNSDTGSVADSLIAGSYNVSITDANGCSIVTSGPVNEPSAINITYLVTDASASNNDGAIDITVTGGVPLYSFLWNNGLLSEDLTNIASGNYSVIVTDANGCTSSSANIQVLLNVGLSVLNSPQALTLSPNPNAGVFQIYSAYNADLSLYSSTGSLVTIIKIKQNEMLNVSLPLSPGVYYLKSNNPKDGSLTKFVVQE